MKHLQNSRARSHFCTRRPARNAHARALARAQVWSYYSQDHPPPDPQPRNVVNERTVSPFNNLLGAVVVTQTRAARIDCSNGGNAGLSAFTTNRNVQCVGPPSNIYPSNSSGGFGVDPTFSVASSLFDGKDMATNYYNGQKIADARSSAKTVYQAPEGIQSINGIFVPFGFFPHWWDTVTRGPKDPTLIFSTAANTYKLYFDVRLQADSVQDLLTYMQDGHFLDDATQTLKARISS